MGFTLHVAALYGTGMRRCAARMVGCAAVMPLWQTSSAFVNQLGSPSINALARSLFADVLQ